MTPNQELIIDTQDLKADECRSSFVIDQETSLRDAKEYAKGLSTLIMIVVSQDLHHTTILADDLKVHCWSVECSLKLLRDLQQRVNINLCSTELDRQEIQFLISTAEDCSVSLSALYYSHEPF